MLSTASLVNCTMEDVSTIKAQVWISNLSNTTKWITRFMKTNINQNKTLAAPSNRHFVFLIESTFGGLLLRNAFSYIVTHAQFRAVGARFGAKKESKRALIG